MSEDSERWANGVTVKKTTSGHTWTVAVAADSNTTEALLAAAEKAAEVEARLRELYPEPVRDAAPRARRSSSR